MPRASYSTLFVLSMALLVQARPLLAAEPERLIKDRRQISLDPLDGIPEEDQKQGKAKGKTRGDTCLLLVTPANDRDVADLRSTVAVIQRGPRRVPCPGDASPLRLRVSIDARGRINAVERVSGDKKLGDSLVRTLTGQLCQSTVSTPTSGIAQITIRRGSK